ncbi:Putative HR1 rho-binding domain, rapamycin-insensitive companion of mTOR domain, Pianissimo family [Septoria linicola]|uniref:HR1 rho-binding domain, rapamycin-insensitive companion of mTOR domain, Pianissimo family n=1 Tax=Septoria linicola TaxID=215465 RepID=A0A9Q9B2I5_9PEZI|nr:Putative HR1 rho-binding domain, rapamycin-insensitive companion of mTOR domain, Pianissimo family [Septoria linicola]
MTLPPNRANGPSVGPNNVLIPPSRSAKDGGSLAAASFVTAKPSQSFVRPPMAAAPGSFTSDLKSVNSRIDLNAYSNYEDGTADAVSSEQKQAEYRQEIEKQTRLKAGTENLLEALNSKNAKKSRDQRMAAESQLNSSNRKIAQLKLDLEAEIQRSKDAPISPKARLSQLFRPVQPMKLNDPRPSQDLDETAEDMDPELESPTYILAEILQALEVDNMQPDYYINQANDLVELFRRHPNLKYDLAWSIFGLRMQVMLLSDSREVVAAGYRVMRYAITDRKSLRTIRALHTDHLVILSLVKESKARVEREQALKFVRAFLDVKDGVQEIHPAVARMVAAVADHSDDQLRSIAILTLAEMLLKEPMLVVNAGGVSVLAEAMGNGVYHAPETLLGPLLHLMDLPARRGVLRSGFEFSAAFATFTEPHFSHSYEDRLIASSRVIASMFKSWSGLMTLSLHNFLPVRSVVSSLYVTDIRVRTATLDLLMDILRIERQSWSTPFIGGRRLTTYARVANLKEEKSEITGKPNDEHDSQKRSLVQHFTAVALAALLRHGLLQGLVSAERDAPSDALKRRTYLLIAEVLKKASELLPTSWNAQLQSMPGLFDSAVRFDHEDRYMALTTVYQVDKVNLKLWRSDPSTTKQTKSEESQDTRARSASKTQVQANMDEALFRARVLETNVLNTINYLKWDWNIILELVDGPLTNPRLLYEALEKSKFVHRLLKFLRPFQFRFSDASNTKANQRYLKMACILIKSLLQTQEGTIFLVNNKTIRQLAECLAQLDSQSGITSKNPMFSPDRLSETLVGGYFQILGVMCSDPKGLQILERWHIINMFYHIVELKNRDDLIRTLLTSLDYALDSHPRIILCKAMIAGSKQLRIMATTLLRPYATKPIEESPTGGSAAEWAIRLLVSQLYDPEIEVCEVAIKILEEACNDLRSLKYVVKCRPALDHLGEIGAPLLLRFLSTSVGYHYLDGLDYITREMDDWFLGRNDSYVTVVEASLARALADVPEKPKSAGLDAAMAPRDFGLVPPHFYRELTRTVEGAELLKAKGHFEEFTATIQDFAMEEEDAETILKVKGCLWAVGNVGSMELGGPFLERTDVVKYIVQIAENSQVMTLRGTAFFVLGLISRSLHGQEILAEHGWDGTVNVMGESLGYVLPLEFDKLFSLQPFSEEPEPNQALLRNRPAPVQDEDPANQAILDAITKLGNTVLTNKALTELNSFKHKKVPGFSCPDLFRKVMILLASHAYRIPQYRFVIDLFEKNVLRRIVLDEEEDTSSSEGSQDGVTA